jgi:hypothetical protein
MATYVKIGSTVEVGVLGAATIDFTAIPSTYTDLKLVASTRTSQTQPNDDITLKFNTSAANFTYRILQGAGSGTPGSYNGSTARGGPTDGNTATSNTFGSFEMYIPNYAGSANKSFSIETVQENNTTTAYAELGADLWSQTAAINAISLLPAGPLFLQYSTASLYGISKS